MFRQLLVTLAIACSSQAFAAGKPHETYYRQGVDLDKKGNYAAAIELYTKAISLKPKTPELFYVRGRAYRQLNQLDAALADFNQAILLRPNYAAAYNYRGVIRIGKQQQQEASNDFNKACEFGSADGCRNRDKLKGVKK